MKQILLPLLATAAFIILVGLMFKDGSSLIKPVQVSKYQSIYINDQEIKVEIAKTPKERDVGLSKRDSLEQGTGMFFIFEEENTKPAFWMKDMEIAIDIIWIDDQRIVQIDKSVQPPEMGTSDNDLQLYTPLMPVDHVLEVNAGFCQENNISVGQNLDLSKILTTQPE